MAHGLGTCGRDVEWGLTVLRTEWRSFKRGSEDNGLLHLHTQAHAHKASVGARPPATPELQFTTHKSVPTRLASFTLLSDIHNSHYGDRKSWYLIISFDMNNLHIFSACLLPGTVLEYLAVLGIEPRASGIAGQAFYH